MDAGTDDVSADATFAPSDNCPAWLQGSAPAAVSGYCPTGTNRSAFAMPDAQPELRWQLDVAADRNVPIVVGPAGRIYLVAGQELVAIDDTITAASVVWTTALGEGMHAPTLLADGSIFVTTISIDGGECIWLSADGAIDRRVDLPAGVRAGAVVDGAGRFIFQSRGDDGARLVATDASCGELWRSEALSRYPNVRLSPNGQLIAGITTFSDDFEPEAWVVGVDPNTGEDVFRAPLGRDSIVQRGPALGDDGAIHIVLWTDASTVVTLVVLEPNGEERMRVALPEPPWGGGLPSLSVASDGTTFVKEGQRLMAVNLDGDIIWERTAHPNIDAVATVDASGLILVGSGGGMGVDAQNGSTVWTSEIPAHQTMLPGGGLSIAFPGPATIGDGTLYYMAADGVLHAASAAP